MKIQIGGLLVSESGEYYRITEHTELHQDVVCLMPLSSQTLFCCRSAFIQSHFRAIANGIADSSGLLPSKSPA